MIQDGSFCSASSLIVSIFSHLCCPGGASLCFHQTSTTSVLLIQHLMPGNTKVTGGFLCGGASPRVRRGGWHLTCIVEPEAHVAYRANPRPLGSQRKPAVSAPFGQPAGAAHPVVVCVLAPPGDDEPSAMWAAGKKLFSRHRCFVSYPV